MADHKSLYIYSAAEAREYGELELWRESHKENCKCARAIEDAISRSFDGRTLAAALLLPLDAITDAMFIFGLGEKLKVLSRKYSQNNYERFCNMAEYLQVSRTALAYRMEQFGLLERNLLVEEAKKRKGVA